jgi:hypothetical protein
MSVPKKVIAEEANGVNGDTDQQANEECMVQIAIGESAQNDEEESKVPYQVKVLDTSMTDIT